MNDIVDDAITRASMGKKRIPKACNICRQSKVRCDEKRPACGRCESLNKLCVYIERPKTAEEQKINELQDEIVLLRQQLLIERQRQGPYVSASTHVSLLHATVESPQSQLSITHPSPSQLHERPLKRKRSHFEVTHEIDVPDFVVDGLLSEQQASSYFGIFFEGCDRFVPIFDESDTCASIRARSSLLFNAICAIGCGISCDISVDSRTPHVRLKRWLTTIILAQDHNR